MSDGGLWSDFVPNIKNKKNVRTYDILTFFYSCFAVSIKGSYSAGASAAGASAAGAEAAGVANSICSRICES